MEFRTGISTLTEDDMLIRGKRHSELIRNASFSDVTFLLLTGREPTTAESRIFNALLVSIIDHGMGTASALASRFVMSTGNPLNSAVAAGVLALGDYHGGAIEQAMRQLATVADPKSFVEQALVEKRIIYGYGHKVYKDADPRVTELLARCEAEGYHTPYLATARSIEAEIEQQKRRLVLNVDGCIAALLLGMGFPPEAGKGIFVIGRTPGLVAQALEEQARERPVRRIDESAIAYDGPQ